MLVTRHEARLTRLLYLEIVFSALPGAVNAFTGPYLLRLGGSGVHVSLVTGLPALAAAFLSIPIGVFLQTRAHPHRWVLASLALYWTGFFTLAFVPWLPIPWLSPATLGVIALGVVNVPAQIFTVGIYMLLQDLTTEHNRIHVFAVRSIINAVLVSGLTLATGQWLERVVFPGNYQVAYTAGWLGGLACVATLAYASRLPRPVPVSGGSAPAPAAPTGQRSYWPRDLGQHRDFIHISLNTFLHSLATWLSAPLLTLYYVRQLGAGDAWLGLYGTLAGVSAIVGLFFWRWVVRRLRVDRTLRLAVLSVGWLPLLAGLVPNLTFILALSALNGFLNAGLTVSHINVLLPTLPEDRRQQFFGLYSALMNAGAFATPLIAVALADRIGLSAALIVSGIVGAFGAAAYWIWRVPGRTAAPVAASVPGVEGA